MSEEISYDSQGNEKVKKEESEDEELITAEFNKKQMQLILEIKDLEEELRGLER